MGKEACWWGHRAHNFLPKTLSPFALLPLLLTLLLLSLLDVKECEEEWACLSFSSLSVGSPLKTQQHFMIVFPSLLLPKTSFAANFFPSFSQVKSPYSLGLMATKKTHFREDWSKYGGGEGEKKEQKKVGRSRYTPACSGSSALMRSVSELAPKLICP